MFVFDFIRCNVLYLFIVMHSKEQLSGIEDKKDDLNLTNQ